MKSKLANDPIKQRKIARALVRADQCATYDQGAMAEGISIRTLYNYRDALNSKSFPVLNQEYSRLSDLYHKNRFDKISLTYMALLEKLHEAIDQDTAKKLDARNIKMLADTLEVMGRELRVEQAEDDMNTKREALKNLKFQHVIEEESEEVKSPEPEDVN